jgi:DNA-binding transcriptional regulator YiaG
MANLIDELNEYRLENRISQVELAEMLKVSFVTVNRWFNRRQEPNQIQKYHINKLISGKRKKR